jgi:hypothetical protein
MFISARTPTCRTEFRSFGEILQCNENVTAIDRNTTEKEGK